MPEKRNIEFDRTPLILVVDDIPKNLQVVGATLYQEGYKIAMVDSGEKVFELLETTIPDLILLDVMMPDMDGYEICEKLKQIAARATMITKQRNNNGTIRKMLNSISPTFAEGTLSNI